MENALARASPKYLLSRHTYLCIDEGYAVLLDLKADRYIGLDPFRARQLSGFVQGWPAAFPDSADALIKQNLSPDTLVRPLLDRGLITADLGSGKDATPVVLDNPTEEIGADTWNGKQSVGIADVSHFIRAVLVAFSQLRLQTIEKIVAHVQALKRRGGSPRKPAEDLARSVATFVRLRPLVFTSRDHCLFECLALSEFLARKRIYADWVFAVHSSPFAAHCWLQMGSIVLNDTLENVQNFTPIMKV